MLSISVPLGGRSRGQVSMSPAGWAIAWLFALPFVAARIAIWIAVRLIVALMQLILWLVRRVHDAPAVPSQLRQPPRR